MNNIGIIILAAGNSSRLGRPKQLLLYRGKTLLTHIVTEALGASLEPVVVVTGAFGAEVSDTMQGQPVKIVYNPRWEEGMASGIAAGLTEMLSLAPHVRAVIVAVCDQPHISAAVFGQLADRHCGSGKDIIGCGYAGTIGTPVLFGSRFFKALATLAGSEGAKKLLKEYPEEVVAVPFPEGAVDIDTEEDVQRAGIDYL